MSPSELGQQLLQQTSWKCWLGGVTMLATQKQVFYFSFLLLLLMCVICSESSDGACFSSREVWP